MNIIVIITFAVVLYTMIGVILGAACGHHALVFQWPIALMHHSDKDCNRAWRKTLDGGRWGPRRYECDHCHTKFSDYADRPFLQCPGCGERQHMICSSSEWKDTDEFPLNNN